MNRAKIIAYGGEARPCILIDVSDFEQDAVYALLETLRKTLPE